MDASTDAAGSEGGADAAGSEGGADAAGSEGGADGQRQEPPQAGFASSAALYGICRGQCSSRSQWLLQQDALERPAT